MVYANDAHSILCFFSITQFYRKLETLQQKGTNTTEHSKRTGIRIGKSVNDIHRALGDHVENVSRLSLAHDVLRQYRRARMLFRRVR